MQKKLIALAVAAAFSAPAFADVTAYGVVDVAVANLSATGQKSDTQVVSGGLATSRFGVKTVEDLNNGMKAVVVLEYALDVSDNSSVGGNTTSAAGAFYPASSVDAGKANGKSPFAARQQMLAVAGDFGTVAGGYLQTAGYDWAKTYDPAAGSAVSPLQNVTKGSTFLIGTVTPAARAQRALAYISPDLSGVTVAVNYSTSITGVGNLTQDSNATLDAKTTAYLLSATYTGVQNLSVGAVYLSATAGKSYLDAIAAGSTGTLSATDFAVGASYDFGVAKVFGTYQTSKTGTNNLVATSGTNKALSVSAVAPVGPGAILVSYAKNTIDDKSTLSNLPGVKIGTGTDMSASGATVAWLQPLSKLTTLYAAYSKMSQGKNTKAYSVDNNILAPSGATGWATGGGSSSLLAVGLSKKF